MIQISNDLRIPLELEPENSILAALKQFPQFSPLDYASSNSEDILELLEEEKDFEQESELVQEESKDEQIETDTQIPNRTWGDSVLSGFHNIPVDNYVGMAQRGSEDLNKTIKEDATLDEIKAFLADNNLQVFSRAMDKMR